MDTANGDRSNAAVATVILERMAREDVSVDELAERIGYRAFALRRRLENEAPFDLEQIDRIGHALGTDGWDILGLAREELGDTRDDCAQVAGSIADALRVRGKDARWLADKSGLPHATILAIAADPERALVTDLIVVSDALGIQASSLVA